MRHLVPTALVGIILPVVILPVVILFVGAAIVLAGDDPTPAPQAPAPQAARSKAGIGRLIQQLGADDFRAREAASKALAAQGEKARAALTAAARSQSPEIRWRAQQLLRRLQGAQEKVLGTEGAQPTPSQRAAGASDGSDLESMLDRARKQMEDFLKARPQVGSLGSLLGKRNIEVPGLTLERSLSGAVTLRVKRAEKPGGTVVEDVYQGHSLKDILTRNPDLAKADGMVELRRRDAEQAWPGMEEFKKHFLGGWPRVKIETSPGGAHGFAFSTSQGVEIQQDADGVRVTLRDKGKDGKEVVREFKGKTLDEIKAAHPELKERLGGVGFSFHIARPEFFWGNRDRSRLDRLHPLRPNSPRALPQPQGAMFGLRLALVSDALRSHIGVAAGVGALVDTVVPGTQAEKIGLRRNDVLTHVNGKAVDRAAAVQALRHAAATNDPLEITLIRRAKPLTLKR